MAAAGYLEALTWSFTARRVATLFGGGDDRLVLANPIAADLDTMRPSILPGLIEALGRNAKRGFPGGALFEIGPIFAGDEPADQRTAIAAAVDPRGPRRWDGSRPDDLFTLKADLMALLAELGAPIASLQVVEEDAGAWWRPGRHARVKLGARTVLADFGEIHPRVLSALDVEDGIVGLELYLEAIPEPKKKAAKTKPALKLSPFMPLTRDFAFVVDKATPAGDLVRAVLAADRTLIAEARVFDVYEGPGVEAGKKSVAIEATVQPVDRTLTDKDIEALSSKVVAGVAKATGAVLRG
jgi:phenylalanyl-tRNA synthetase beta chain